MFRVHDSGPGVPEAVRRTLFERGMTPGSGVGLGLRIASHAAQALGGSLALETSAGADAQGTTFVLEVPRTPPDRERASGSPDQPHEPEHPAHP